MDQSDSMTRLPIKIALGFAVAGYLVAIGLHVVRSTWHPSPVLVFSICPANILTMISMTDPSFGGIATIVAPLNAVLYGVVGLLIGLGIQEFRDGKASTGSS
jgi:hypothetical protein